jgi:hypothetical protein
VEDEPHKALVDEHFAVRGQNQSKSKSVKINVGDRPEVSVLQNEGDRQKSAPRI